MAEQLGAADAIDLTGAGDGAAFANGGPDNETGPQEDPQSHLHAFEIRGEQVGWKACRAGPRQLLCRPSIVRCLRVPHGCAAHMRLVGATGSANMIRLEPGAFCVAARRWSPASLWLNAAVMAPGAGGAREGAVPAGWA